MTVRLYYEDSYLKDFSAKILAIDSDLQGVVLDQTVFYPGGGGQPADRGSLKIDGQSIQLKGFKLSQNNIIHILPENSPLPEIGKLITGEIDWDHRYKLMRTHTAMHILCGVIFRDYGASVTGGNMTPLHGRMDFEFASLHGDLVSVIEDAVNLEIHNSLPVSWREIPRSEAVKIPDLIRTKINLVPKSIENIRVVEIQGLDLQADGGTHVRNTTEVKPIKITDYKSKGKENKRIYLQLSDN
jgi:misacylated tRNA(Ala) deacylase